MFKSKSKKAQPAPVNRITITLLPNQQTQVKVDSPADFETLTQLLCTCQLHFMNQITNSAPPENRQEVRDIIYDSYNRAASKTLELFSPETELRPDLTVEAIRNAENDLITAKFDQLTPEQQAQPVRFQPKGVVSFQKTQRRNKN